MRTFVFFILCILGISSHASCYGGAWYRQPPYRYYWKKQREYQRYHSNQQQKRQQEAQKSPSETEEKPQSTPSPLTPAKLKLGSKEYEYVRARNLNEKKAESQ
ncbi:MAG: hypothetical protein JJU12_01475 [Chlamydiales bacterium]|nr:hypothetical protein [Chlamydiales bacterium]